MKYTIKSFMYSGKESDGSVPEMQDALRCAEESGFFAVADGNGPDGAKASALAVKEFTEKFASRQGVDTKKIAELLGSLNQKMQNLDGGASLAFACVQGQQLTLFNLGATKAFVFRDDQPVAVLPQAQLTWEPCRQSVPEGPVNWKAEPGDAVVLCTCGFWNSITPLEMELDLLKSRNATDWVQYMVCRILMKLGKKGVSRNLSVIALLFTD